MKIIIIGAGLGGLAAAYRFAQQGHEVHVYERQAQLSRKGSGIMLRPGASRILIKWGLQADMDAVADDSPSALLRDLQTGEIWMRNVAVDVSEYPDWGLPRRVMQDLLYKRALAAGAQITFGTAVDGVGEDEDGASVMLHDGTYLKADLVLAADGIRSRTRTRVLGESTDPVVSPTTFYSVSVPAEQLLRNPETRGLYDQVNLTIYMGRDGFVVTRASKKCGVWGGLFGIKADTNQQSLWDEDGDIEYVRDFFISRGICPELAATLNMVESCDRWKLAQTPNIPRWTSEKGRIVLLGDSAHAMEPNAAQGFSQTIEDIEVLEYLLSTRSSHHTIRDITTTWQEIRKPRVERIKAYAHWNTRMFLGEPLASTQGNEQRNIKSLKDIKPNRDASFHSSAFVKWAHDYDAVGEAQKHLDSQGDKARL